MKIEVDFPCGYHLKIKQSFIQMLLIGKFVMSRGSCPIHGNKCSKLNKRGDEGK